MDYAYLDRLHQLERAGHKYQWRIKGLRSIELPNPLAKIRLGKPNFDLPIAGTDFPTPTLEIPQCTVHRCPHHSDDIGASTSDAPPPPYSAAPSFDFQAMMSMLQRVKSGITPNSAAILSISQRVDTLATDQHLAMYPMYDEHCKIYRITKTDPYPSQYTPGTQFTASQDPVGGGW